MATLSIIVPVYNEERQLAAVVEKLMKVSFPCAVEWIFVDDHSTDRSRELLRELSRLHRFKLIEQPVNQGKGSAIIRGLHEASGDFVVIQDADFEYDPSDISTLVAPLLAGRADVVYGSRFKNGAQVHRTFHSLINRFLTALSNLMSGLSFTDMETCYKLFRTDIIKAMRLKSRRFGIEIELTAYVAKIHVRVFELPISYFPRTHLQGKKINWKDGFAALWHLVRFNWLTSRDQAFDRIPQAVEPKAPITS